MQHGASGTWRGGATLLTLVFTVACVDAPIAPTALTPSMDVLGLALSNKPAPADVEGQAWVCKEGTGPSTNFTFAVSVEGGTAQNHSIANGTCAMVHNVPKDVTNQAAISVTEINIPADWALSSIIIESNSSNTNHYLPVINSPNATARILNDVGVIITFTNTYTPPSNGCTLTQGYWKTHPEDWDQVADGKPFLTTTTFYNSGQSYLTILHTSPRGGNAYLQLAHQFIAARLNVNGGTSGVASVDAALSGAHTYFGGAPAGIPNPTGATRTQLQSWATTLDNFNNGLIGPGHCD